MLQKASVQSDHLWFAGLRFIHGQAGCGADSHWWGGTCRQVRHPCQRGAAPAHRWRPRWANTFVCLLFSVLRSFNAPYCDHAHRASKIPLSPVDNLHKMLRILRSPFFQCSVLRSRSQGLKSSSFACRRSPQVAGTARKAYRVSRQISVYFAVKKGGCRALQTDLAGNQLTWLVATQRSGMGPCDDFTLIFVGALISAGNVQKLVQRLLLDMLEGPTS
jgi:hypothetical protein